jgi:hypothetical protein
MTVPVHPAKNTAGCTMAQLTDQGAEFTTLTHLKDHPWNGAVTKLAWRST